MLHFRSSFTALLMALSMLLVAADVQAAGIFPRPIPPPRPIPTPTPIPTPSPKPTPAPVGVIDVVYPDGAVDGWALDHRAPSQPARIHVFVDGDSTNGVSLDILEANQERGDLPAALGIPNMGPYHGFRYYLPARFMDGNTHTLYIYRLGVEGSGTQPELLGGSGKTFKFEAPIYDFVVEVFNGSLGANRRLPGALVEISGDSRKTDGNGFSHLPVRRGQHTIRVSADGYETQEFSYLVERNHVDGFPSDNGQPSFRVELKRPFKPGIQGQLRIVPGGGFADDSGPVLPVLAHFGDALSRWSRGQQGQVLADLDRIKAAGFDGIRFWSTLGGDGSNSGYWAGRAVSPTATRDYWAHVEAFLTACRDRGLVVQLSQGDVYADAIPDRRDFAYRMAEVVNRVGPQTVALFEGANESRDTGEPDASRLAQFVSWFKERAPAPLVGLSAYTGTEDVEVLNDFSRAPADLFVVHSYRGGRWWDKVRHIFSLQYEGKPNKRIGWNGEGPGYGALVSAIDNKHEIDGEVYQILAAVALMTRQAYVWFTGPGVISDHTNGERLENMPGFNDVARVKEMLPNDVMWYTEGFSHGGDSWASRRAFRAVGETRADQVTNNDGRFCTVIYGDDVHAIQPVRSFSVTHDTWIGNKGRVVCGRFD